MPQSNIYAQKENGDLRLIAEVEGESDPALAVDALLDEMPRLKQRNFIVIDLDNVITVEAGDEIVQPRRKITVSNGAAVASPQQEEEDEEDDEEDDEPEEEQEEAPKPQQRRQQRKPAAKSKPASKRAAKRSPRKSSPFRANPASAE